MEGGRPTSARRPRSEPDDGWAGAVIVADADPEGAFALCRALRKRDLPLEPLLLLVTGGQLADLELRDDLFDDFCLVPVPPARARGPAQAPVLADRPGTRPELVEYGAAGAQPRDLPGGDRGPPARPHLHGVRAAEVPGRRTPGKVFTRETLLSRVWGYEYYGGARTVDVHIRRLRAKLGEEHANLIQTVRSVGYRFGQSRWGV